jgi:hypothetical protein
MEDTAALLNVGEVTVERASHKELSRMCLV